MSNTTSERGNAAVCRSPEDAAVVEKILAGLRGEGLAIRLSGDASAGALLVFVSKAALEADDCFDEVAAARARGVPVVPVLLERIELPGDLPARWVALLPAQGAVEAFDKPDEDKRRGILGALAAFGIAGAATEAAEAGTIGGQTVAPQATQAASSSSGRVVQIDPLAKSNAAVVKASSSTSAKLIAYGGAAAATVLVVGAIVIFQGDKDRAAAPDRSMAESSTAASGAADRGAGTPTEPRVTPEDIATGGARVRLAQESYPVGVPIPVRVEGMPGNDSDYVAIAEAGSPGSGEVTYEYLRGRKEAEIVLRPVMKAGKYEVRLFFGNDQERNKSDQIRFAVPLTITPAAPITLTPERTILPEGNAVRVAYDGLPGNDKDWIATAEAGSPDGNYIAYVYSGGAKSGTASLPPLTKPGKYEIRVYFDDMTSDRTVQARVPIEVTPAPPVNLQLDSLTYAPGATIIVTFNTMPGNQRDWLALGRAGDDGYLTYEYTDGKTSGTETFRAPDEPGKYEVRAYFDDATGDKTVRAVIPFEVGAASAPTP